MFLAVTGILLLVTYNQEQRRRIGDVVRRTRIAKGLNKEGAARTAGVNSITWKRVEDAQGVRDASLGKIISLLELPDVDTILGAEPIEIAPTRSRHWLDDLSTGEIIERIRVLFGELRRRIPEASSVDKPEDWPESFFEGIGDEPPPVRRRKDSNERS